MMDIVARDDRDFDPHAQLLCQRHHAPAGRQRIGCAHIGDDADPVAQRDRQQRADALLEQGIEACGRIGELSQLRERDGALGKAFQREVVELALRGEDYRGLEAVALEAGARADADGLRLTQAGSRPA
jgi:hypothetical protein